MIMKDISSVRLRDELAETYQIQLTRAHKYGKIASLSGTYTILYVWLVCFGFKNFSSSSALLNSFWFSSIVGWASVGIAILCLAMCALATYYKISSVATMEQLKEVEKMIRAGFWHLDYSLSCLAPLDEAPILQFFYWLFIEYVLQWECGLSLSLKSDYFDTLEKYSHFRRGKMSKIRKLEEVTTKEQLLAELEAGQKDKAGSPAWWVFCRIDNLSREDEWTDEAVRSQCEKSRDDSCSRWRGWLYIPWIDVIAGSTAPALGFFHGIELLSIYRDKFSFAWIHISRFYHYR